MRLKGKNALVTGSSRGIGRGIAIRYAQEGANVAINYVGAAQAAEDTLAAVTAYGVRGVILPADVANVGEVQALVERAAAELGPLDILVNNAGIEKHAPFWEVTEQDYDKVIDVNLKGVFFATQAMVRHLRSVGRAGRIINISSVHEELAFPNFSAYCASKGALRMLARNLAVELGPLGISVNNIAPGAIETPINTSLLNDPAKLGALLHQIPLNRLGQPDDVAGLAVFLGADEAGYVTGSTFVVDGGLSVNYMEQ
ncbi:MAG: glucose 1-dehydrogenase [Acidobacteriota bacterium]|nr:glucose 1-dehydrogenase [Acidobacteriota bacterium]